VRRRRCAATLAAGCALAAGGGLGACGGGGEAREDAATSTASATSRPAGSAVPSTQAVNAVAPRTCTPAQVASSAPPAWAAAIPGVPEPPMPFALGTGDRAAAFLFVFPLKVHRPRGGANKILWAVEPGAGSSLTIDARREARGPARRFTAPGGDAGGRIFRTRLRFARAGCWRLSLRWDTHRASLDVRVR
jgi:hypothetical protein